MINEDRRELTNRELDIYKGMASLTKQFLMEFESNTNSQKYNDIKKFYLDLSLRIIDPAQRMKEVRTDDIAKINVIINKDLDLYTKYKSCLVSKDSSAMNEIKELMNNQTQEKNLDQVQSKAHDELATNSNIRKNK